MTGFLLITLTALDAENTVGYQAFALLLFLLLASSMFTLNFRIKISAVRLLPRYATVGHPCQYRVRFTNLSRKKQDGLTLMDTVSAPGPTYEEWVHARRSSKRGARFFQFLDVLGLSRTAAGLKEVEAPSTGPGETGEAIMQVTPLRRGVLRFSEIVLGRPDPVGLIRALMTIRQPQSLVVLPMRHRLPPLALPGATKYQQGGVTFASNVGQSEEFVALRDYRRGDPLRHIHWRSWARIGRPIVKEFEDEFFVRHALVLDTFADESSEDLFEEAVSVAASFGCALLTQESLLDLLFVGPEAYCFSAGRGLAHTDQILEILASVNLCSDKPFDALEKLVAEHTASVSGCICVFLGWDEPRQRLVRQLKLIGMPLLVLVVAEHGAGMRLKPGPLADDPAQFRVLELGKIARGLAEL